MQHWKQICEMLLKAVDPEFCSRPIYLFDAHEDSEDLCRRFGHRAYTSTWLDLRLSEVLVRSKEWRGRGFAAVVDVEAFGYWREVFGTVLHEAAHFLTQPVGSAVVDPITAAGEIQSLLSESAPVIATRSGDRRPWDGHGQEFVRAACHLAYRTGLIATPVQPSDLAFGERYYGSSYSEFAWMLALGTELERSTRQRIRDVIKTPPPNEFVSLWKRATK